VVERCHALLIARVDVRMQHLDEILHRGHPSIGRVPV
jgi:hypothetical protein